MENQDDRYIQADLSVGSSHEDLRGNEDDPYLCNVCAKVDLEYLFTEEIELQDAYSLGPLRNIKRKASICVLCDAVVESLNARLSFHPSTADEARYNREEYGTGEVVRCWMYSKVFVDNNDGTKTLRIFIPTLSFDEWEISVEDGAHEVELHAGTIQLMSSSAVSSGILPKFYGRPMSIQPNMDLGRAWIESCESLHGLTCRDQRGEDENSLLPERPQRLLVIDTERRCLVKLPPSEKYTALSYRWPKKPGLINTKAKAQMMGIDGYLSKSNGLSDVVDQGITFAAGLGARYLWVDALCIPQDDHDVKSSIIQQMCDIYGRSAFTLVIAPHLDDISIEVPQSATLRRQRVWTVHGIDVSVPKPYLDFALNRSSWSRRGWTFQEGLMSPRIFYLTSHQMWFQCPGGVRCEDTICEELDPSARITTWSNLSNSRAAFPSLTSPPCRSDLRRVNYEDSEQAFEEYSGVIEDYGDKELTLPSDILNAFDGVMKVFRHTMQTQFISGLPEQWFDRALLWSPGNPHIRRVTECPGNPFPSWSWCGWHKGGSGGLQIFDHGSVDPLFTWLIASSGTAVPREIRCDRIPEFERHSASRSRLGLAAHDPKAAAGSTIHVERSNVLLASTAYAKLYIRGGETGVGTFAHTDHPNAILVCTIRDAVGDAVGRIEVPKSWYESFDTGLNGVDFVLLSELLIEPYRAIDHLSEDLLEHSFDDEEEDICLLNVMVTEPCSETTVGRVGIGWVFEEAWISASPTSYWLQLE
jgi:hypothetical protein